MKQNSTTFALLAVVGAVLAWCAVGYLVWQISSMQTARADLIDKVEQASARQTAAARTHAILQETSSERATLVDTSRVDVLSVVKTIESIGKTAGAVLEVKGAQPLAPVAARAGVPPLRPIMFSIQGTGSFSAVMRAAALLETIPFPADITQLELFRTALGENVSNTAEVWRIGATVRLLTTSDISS